MRRRSIGASLLAALWLTGCAGLPRPAPCPPILPPQPVAGWSGAQSQAEVITLLGPDGHRRQLLVVGERSPQLLRLRGFNLIGLELFRLDHHEGSPEIVWLTGEAPALDARVLVSDYQLVHWPADSLAGRLDKGRWRLDHDTRSRRLYCRDMLIAEVQFAADGSARLFNHQLGYTLEIRPVPASAEPIPDAS
ncbi:DUF3261 domain-containing protein [Abyssibacter sp.]|uniref:DUF3261 domain-containing protein n=1 Tax=Abyssibacter sp. TaxID=2320200 RepID=UPI0025C4E58D|nr:DUF3261 domain-containing protein [Abyssibacter sp.]MCK5860563.1 DUF3261 domain-containing protein [Abyssibacter sp.]